LCRYVPGLAATIAFVGASIKQITHERAWLQEDSHSVQVDVTCELTGPQMGEALYEALAEKYPVDFTRPKEKLTNVNADPLSSTIGNNDSAGMMAGVVGYDKSKSGGGGAISDGAGPKKLPPPTLYDYDTIVNNVKPSAKLVEAVVGCFTSVGCRTEF
jgi:hypothetical protein